jgi:hypothetical protein
MKKHIKQSYVLLLFLFATYNLKAQGCVAIRGNSSCNSNLGSSANLMGGEFNFQTGYRYFKSFRHFRGDHEEANRVEDGTEVINHSHFLDLSLSYGITDRLYANILVPYVWHTRSSLYEHGGNGLGDRRETSSLGVGDFRVGIGYWLFEPGKKNFNYSLGLGLKLPIGRYDYTDTFYNQGSNDDQDVEGVVDQSIQPGDGGKGFTVDIQGYHTLSDNFGLSVSVYYLFNTTETNGVLTRNGRSEFSSPDQFAVRLGSYYSSLSGFNAYLGGRIEGVPSDDLIGGSAGYRRPGYAVSVEPGIGYFKHNYSIFASVPIALYRNRTQSYEDKQRTAETGEYRIGDAAFADYLINVGISYRFMNKNKEKEIPKIDLNFEHN